MNFRVNINVCRICMKSGDGVSLLDDKKLGEKFVFTTRLKLSENDNMPSIICKKCFKRLHIAHDFVKLAHESEKNLKAFLSKISEDFQLVTNKNADKFDGNGEDEDDDDLLSTILEDESNSGISDDHASELVPEQNDNDAQSHSQLPSKRNPVTREYVTAKQDNQEQGSSNYLKDVRSTILKEEVISENSNNDEECQEPEQMELYSEEESSSKFERSAGLTEIVEMQPVLSDQLQNENSSDHEIQVLDMTDVESQTELEVLEVNLHPSDDTHSSNEVEQKSRRSDGFFKEYQTVLDDADEYLEDNHSVHSKTTNEVHSLDADEEILEDHVKSIEEQYIGEEHDADAVRQYQTKLEDIGGSESETKGKTRKTQSRTNNRNSSGRIAKRGDGLNTSKRFLCFKCNRDFSTKTNLTRHMATHEGSRPFQCKVCDKTFTQNVSLKQHMYTHTGEKPYQCVVCCRGFTQCKSLVFHMRRHTGEKPFPCEKCGALFRQKDGLKTHILKRHINISQQGDVEVITCSICKQVLADKNSLQEHIRKHLNDYVRVDSTMSCANREGNIEENANINVMLEYVDDDPLNDKSNATADDSSQENTADISSSAHVVDLMTTSALEPSRAKKYQCRICFKCFAIKINLLRHLTTHNIAVMSEEFYCKLPM